MKIEIEVTDDEMRDALQRHIRTAVADRVNNWGMSEKVKKLINEKWDEVATRLIEEAIADHPTLRAQIREELVKKIKRSLISGTKDTK